MEAGLVRICGTNELPPEGGVTEVSAGQLTLCVARLNGRVSVLDNECPHHGGPLGEGTIEDGKVVCPWHAYAFDLVTGAADGPGESVKVYEVTVEGADVLVRE